jgi:GMP synthase-like glutamine amidotransferase
MFLDLLTQAAQQENLHLRIKISVYRVQLLDLPESFRDFDGVLLPGSFSAAYDSEPWIVHLKDVIRDQLWADRIPSMGVCFGHQIMAHAMETQGGLAMKCPSDPKLDVGRSGPKNLTTVSARIVLRMMTIRHSTYSDTHGDMVQSLPHVAKSLGGTPQVPILGAVYYCDEQHPLVLHVPSSS